MLLRKILRLGYCQVYGWSRGVEQQNLKMKQKEVEMNFEERDGEMLGFKSTAFDQVNVSPLTELSTSDLREEFEMRRKTKLLTEGGWF